MQRIPLLTKPIEDELLYSFLYRLSKLNAITSLPQFVNLYLWPNSPYTSRNNLVPAYDANPLVYGYLKSGYCENPVRFYLDHTIYGGIAPFLKPAAQTRMINTAFRPRGQYAKLNTTGNSSITELKYCPMCEKEDRERYGTRIFYRYHNMPGVSMCWRHHVPLRIYTDSVTHLNDPDAKSREIEIHSEGAELAYSGYAMRFCKAEPDTDAERLKYAILNELKARNWSFDDLAYEIMRVGLNYCFSEPVQNFMKIRMPMLSYANKQSLLAICVTLFPDTDHLPLSYNKETALQFIQECINEYDVFKPFRMNIVLMRRKDTGEQFVTTADGFLSTWREISADNGKPEEKKFEEVFNALQDGSYSLLTPFQSMDVPISVKHEVCGKVLQIKPRNFIEEGTRCPCENVVSMEEAAEQVRKETDGEFILKEFSGTAYDAVFIHSDCGRSFRHIYKTFIDHPRCPFCNQWIKSNDSFTKEIRDLTGDEYTLVSDYVDKGTKVKIRHNVCGTVQEYYPRHFLSGERCNKCAREISEERFEKIVYGASFKKYSVTRKTYNVYDVIDNQTGNVVFSGSKYRIIQELKRPTPSRVLPLDKKDSVEMPKTYRDRILEYIRSRYDENSLIFLEDIHIDGIPYSIMKTRISDLTKMGELHRVASGVFSFCPIKVGADRLIKEKYLVRNGHNIGMLYGKSLEYELGLIEKAPERMLICTNKEASTNLDGRVISVMGTQISVKGSEFLITDNNFRALEVIELARCVCMHRWSKEKAKAVTKVWNVSPDDVSQYFTEKMSDRQKDIALQLAGE